MRLRTVLIAPPSDLVEDDGVDPPLGLLYVAAVLRERDDSDVSVFDLTGGRQRGGRLDDIPDAEIYGISCLCTNYPNVRLIVERIRTLRPGSYVALGGANPTAMPEFTLQDSGADAVAVGEGEDVFADLVERISRGSRPRGIFRGSVRQDIDSYPFPERDLVDLPRYTRSLDGHKALTLLGSRGCTYRCVHCNSVVMGGGAAAVRYRSAAGICEEISCYRDRYECFRFTDDHFTGHPRLLDVLRGIERLRIRYRIFARVEDLTEEVCASLAASGCRHVTIGLESLNPANLRALGKGSMIGGVNNVRTAKRAGLTVRSSFMVGLPCDSDESIAESFEKAAVLGIDEFAVYPIIPYPGTLLADSPERFGYRIVDRDFSTYLQMGRGGRTSFALEHERFGPKDVERWLCTATAILRSAGSRHMSESRVAC